VDLGPSSETTLTGSLPALGEVPQDLAADQIVPEVWDEASTPADGPGSFVEIFRSSTPYIKMHRASTMVFHLDTRILDEERLLADLMDDVALITVLGVTPVLVISIRDQVDARLREMGVEPRFHGELRISDATVIRVLQEVSGLARSRVEAALSRGRSKSSKASASAVGGGVAVGVVGGNTDAEGQAPATQG
jgi:amino-acid N-acetyltransferase